MTNKRIVIVDGTTTADKNAFVDAALNYSENIVYHSVLDNARHIASIASIGYSRENTDKDAQLLDDITEAVDKYCNLSKQRFIECVDSFKLLPELDILVVYCRWERIHDEIVKYCYHQNIPVEGVFITSDSECDHSDIMASADKFNTVISRNDPNFGDKVIRFICKAPM